MTPRPRMDRVFSIAGICMLAHAAPSLASAADSLRVALRTGDQTVIRALPLGASELRAISPGAAPAAGVALPAGAARRFIVRFGAAPIAALRRRAVQLEAARAPYRRFLAEVASLEAEVRAAHGADAAALRVGRRLEVSFNGVAIRASRAMADRIRRLPYVTGVFADDSVHALLDQSLAQIRADSLRAAFSVTGSGVLVAIVDTGIDYLHPALGGCLGPPCRVIGGYDFVNGDPDPSDDHGHGTHVAGIVGGNGAGLTGVAPGVRFLACKVLDASGGGLESDVIAGIDFALDPDGNPLTSDGASVINLSLGGLGDADDPISQAVDQAVAAGTVCVVAAGNSGAYATILSPGCARLALTVGAVTASDQIAPFSSRGPAAPDDAIKPDVVAPGTNIVSTWPGGGALALSGTSMAAPHVAGVVALLREIHPDWNPATIGAALMNTARDLGVDPFQQGAGRIDALLAGTTHVTLSPGSLGFGLAPSAAPAWSATRGLVLRNDSTAARDVALSAVSNLPAGSWLDVSPASVALGPGETRSVTVTLALDHAPVVAAEPWAYRGEVRASVDGRTLRVPFAVLRASQLVVRVDDAGLVIVHDRASFDVSLFAEGPKSSRLFVPSGTYDVLAALGTEYRLVREGIVVADSSSVDLRESDATCVIERTCVDEHGAPVETPFGVEYLRHRDTGVGIMNYGGVPSTVRFSPASAAYEWEWQRLSYAELPATYDFRGFARGITASAAWHNAPGDLRRLGLDYHPAPSLARLFPMRWLSDGPLGIPLAHGFAVTSFALTGGLPPLDPPFRQDLYFIPTPDTSFHFKSWRFEGYPDQGLPYPTGAPDFASPYLVGDPGQPMRGYVYGDATEPVVSAASDLAIGLGPLVWFGRFRNHPDALELSPVRGRSGWIFLGQQGDWRDQANLPFELWRAGALVESGTMTGGLSRTVVPGAHTLNVTNDRGWIAGQPARTLVVATFNTLAADPDPPFLNGLAILVNGAPAETASHPSPVTVRFTMEDAVALDSVTLAARFPGQAWSALPLTRAGNQFEASVPTSAGGALALLVEGTDATGNRLSVTLEPALAIAGVTSVEPTAPAERAVTVLALDPMWPNPARGAPVVRFSLPDQGRARLEVLDLMGRVVIAREVGTLGAGRHEIDLGKSRRWAPGVYLVRLTNRDRSVVHKACVIE